MTAQAVTTGTPAPLPVNVWTATPSPTFAVVTLTPTPAGLLQALERAQAAATQRAVEGTATPFPPNFITATPNAVVVPAVAAPQNVQTAQVVRIEATIAALLYGTATPIPDNWVTMTPVPPTPPLPLLVWLADVTPTPGPPPSEPGISQIPDALRGRILFMSDRFGRPDLFVMDPDGGNVQWVTRTDAYDLAKLREAVAPDGVRRVIVKPAADLQLQIQLVDPRYNVVRGITSMTGTAYDPAWSPASDRIVFVDTEPGNDEIYAINVDSSGLQRLTANSWEWDKHPSWSPDGKQIAFYSNRNTGLRQIWLMNADGSGQRNLSDGKHNDWDPVWVK
jgi:hypothetical protein